MLNPVRLNGLDCGTVNSNGFAIVKCCRVAECQRNCEDELHGVCRHILEHIVASEEVGHTVGDARSELADDLVILVEEQHTGSRTGHSWPAHLLHAINVHLINSRC